MTSDIKTIVKEAREKLEASRIKTQEKLNKNGINKNLKENDYVFIKDRTEIPGAPRPLKTKLDPSPYVVVKVKHTTVLVKRLSDGFTSLYSMDDVKKFDAGSPLFADIPEEVGKVLLHDFTELMSEDFCTVMKYDELQVPNSIPLTLKDIQKNEKGKDENEEEILENEFQKTSVIKDIKELNEDKELLKKEKIEKFSDSESEEESDEENGTRWESRLRPRKKKVTFAK